MKSAIDYLIIINERQANHNFDIGDIPYEVMVIFYKRKLLVGDLKTASLTAEGFEISEKKY